MSDRPDLHPCVVKGCAWRGRDPYACPMHVGVGWDGQKVLRSGLPSKHHTRHRS